MGIIVAGPVCDICDDALQAVEQVIAEHDLQLAVERVTDFQEIIALGVYAVPGIIVGDTVKSVGRVPDPGEILLWIAENDPS